MPDIRVRLTDEQDARLKRFMTDRGISLMDRGALLSRALDVYIDQMGATFEPGLQDIIATRKDGRRKRQQENLKNMAAKRGGRKKACSK